MSQHPQALNLHHPHCCDATVSQTCTSCGRALCAWHFALAPVDLSGKVELVPVCWPPCKDGYWEQPFENRDEERTMRANAGTER